MNFVQGKRKKTYENEIADLQLPRGGLIQLSAQHCHAAADRRSGFDNNYNDDAKTIVTEYGRTTTCNSSVYVAITSGRGYAQSEIGIASIDLEHPIAKLIQFSDDHWYTGLLTKINILQPCQIIVPQTLFEARAETAEGKLMKYLREEFPSLCVVKIPRRHFSDSDGMDLITKYASKKFAYIIQTISSKYYALSAISALVKYLQHSLHVNFRENSLKLEFETKYGHLLMDVETAKRLELLKVDGRYRIHSSLFDILNYCVTAIGKRTLRARILEPHCDVAVIRSHHESIQELNCVANIQMKPIISGLLKNFSHVDRLHKLAFAIPQEDNIRMAEILINQTIQLRMCLKLVPVLRIKLHALQCKPFDDIKNGLADERYQLMLDHIDSVLNKEMAAYPSDGSNQIHQRVNCIQSGKNDLIDMMRNIFNDLMKELHDLISSLSTRYGQAFKLQHNSMHEYHMKLMVSAETTESDIPAELDVLEMKRNYCLLSASELKRLNIRINGVVEEITIQSNVILAHMLTEITAEIDAVYDLTGIVASLDIAVALATVSSFDGYVCPEFGEEIRIVNGIHPLLERNVRNDCAVPNNIIATPDFNFFLITGPNMSGKTIYLKMIAILQIMAQLGCFVPATSAQFRIADRIFTRIGTNDSIEKNASSFILETRRLEHILKNITQSSLVLIDELFRSTNPEEGAQLAWAFCEHLLSMHGKVCRNSLFNEPDSAENEERETSSETVNNASCSRRLVDVTAPFAFVTTHFACLTRLTDWYFNVVNLSFSVDEITGNDGLNHLRFNHRIHEGVTAIESYGLKLADSVRFPDPVVPRAKQIYHELKIRDECAENIIQRNANRRPSALAYEISKSALLAKRGIDELRRAPSVISVAMPDPRANAAECNRSIATNANTASASSEETCFKIDRILYNLYGDLASAMRKCSINDDDPDSARETRAAALTECLETFVTESDDKFTESILEALLRGPGREKRSPTPPARESLGENEPTSELNDYENASQLISSAKFDFEEAENEFECSDFALASLMTFSGRKNRVDDSIFNAGAHSPSSLTGMASANFFTSLSFDSVSPSSGNRTDIAPSPSAPFNRSNEYAPFDSLHFDPDNNSKTKYPNTFNSIRSDIKLRKSNSKDNQNLSVRRAEADVTQARLSVGTNSTENRMGQKRKVAEPRPKSLDAEQSERFQRLHRIAVGERRPDDCGGEPSTSTTPLANQRIDAHDPEVLPPPPEFE